MSIDISEQMECESTTPIIMLDQFKNDNIEIPIKSYKEIYKEIHGNKIFTEGSNEKWNKILFPEPEPQNNITNIVSTIGSTIGAICLTVIILPFYITHEAVNVVTNKNKPFFDLPGVRRSMREKRLEKERIEAERKKQEYRDRYIRRRTGLLPPDI